MNNYIYIYIYFSWPNDISSLEGWPNELIQIWPKLVMSQPDLQNVNSYPIQ